MIDLVGSALDAVLRNDLGRLPLVALCGVVTSVGPCVAPRYVALAALLESSPRPALTIVTFLSGLSIAYATLGFGLGLLALVSAFASWTYAVLAATLIGFGGWTLFRRPRCRHAHTARLAPPFVVGALSVLVISPCCSPMLAAVAGLAAVDRTPWTSAAFLLTFALGHVLPLVFAGQLGAHVSRWFERWNSTHAPTTVAGGLMLALGGYYGLLA